MRGWRNSPQIGQYLRNYYQARDTYALALTAVRTNLEALNGALVSQAEYAGDEFSRREAALSRASAEMDNAYWSILPYTALADVDPAFEPIADAADDLKLMAAGLSSLGQGFGAFATEISARKLGYPAAPKWLESEQNRAAQTLGFNR
jgi:hypothetical protein